MSHGNLWGCIRSGTATHLLGPARPNRVIYSATYQPQDRSPKSEQASACGKNPETQAGNAVPKQPWKLARLCKPIPPGNLEWLAPAKTRDQKPKKNRRGCLHTSTRAFRPGEAQNDTDFFFPSFWFFLPLLSFDTTINTMDGGMYF